MSTRTDSQLDAKVPPWKRVEDLVVLLPALVVAVPAVVLAVVGILLDDGWPVLFSDERVGVAGRRFRLHKLRTMVREAEHKGLGRAVGIGDERITRTGRFLRRFSLDELPQLWSVLIGEMSIVGPRPTIPAQVAKYSPRHVGRLRVRPGLTGLAQVSGRNDLSWTERIEYDLEYVQKMSLWLDLEILLRTPAVIVGGIGLYGRGGVTPDYDPPDAGWSAKPDDITDKSHGHAADRRVR